MEKVPDWRKEMQISQTMYDVVHPEMQAAFRQLEKLLPEPREVQSSYGPKFRYVERLPKQAILLKALRTITGIQSAWILLKEGFTQECASIQRILVELNYDILFLSGPIIFNEKEQRHDIFLAEFYQEEFEEDKTALESPQKRHRVSRENIRAYCSRVFSIPEQVSTASNTLRTIETFYSGYIHAAAPHIFDYCFGHPPKFHTEGVAQTHRQAETAIDFRNDLFRIVAGMATTAKALGDDELYLHLQELLTNLNGQFDMRK